MKEPIDETKQLVDEMKRARVETKHARIECYAAGHRQECLCHILSGETPLTSRIRRANVAQTLLSVPSGAAARQVKDRSVRNARQNRGSSSTSALASDS
jgi:hypothetical protein